jgi:hypothetical protein
MDPQAFEGGLRPLDGKGAFLVGSEEWPENPRRIVAEEFFEVVTLWRLCRSGVGGFAAMPEGGGVTDQAAWLLDAFDLLSAFASELEKARGAQ